MVGSQLDHDSQIQDVLSWKDSPDTWPLGAGGLDGQLDRPFIPSSALEAKFKEPGKVEGLLRALFGNNYDHPLPDADYIRKRYLRSFVILLCVGQGRMIHHFVEHESLQDGHLPFRAAPEGFPSSTTLDLWEKFKRIQWGFCATGLEYNMSYHLGPDQILPIIHKERLGEGGSAVTHKVTVHRDYDSLDPPGSPRSNGDQKHNVYVVKTYRTAEAKTYFDTERNAFRTLKNAGPPPSNIIGFYGSFQRGECFNIVLEYADLGSLEEYMQKVHPPSSTEDTILFWESFFGVTHGLVTIHGTQEGNPKEPQILLGWHNDVKPSNILVIRRSATSLYDCYFKLADLGLSHFKRHVGPRQGATHRDPFGTHAYGAPETCRMDRALEGLHLEVKQDVDIWSMGCVYSEVTTWVDHGSNKVDEYRRRRRAEFKEKTKTNGECFHDGEKTLVAVEQIHSETLSNRRVSDHVTPSVLEKLVQDMMVVKGPRLPAKHIFHKSKQIIKQAKAKVDETSHNIAHHERGPAPFGGGQLRMPPNLPPGVDIGTRNDSPYTAERVHDLRDTQSNGYSPHGRPFSPTSQYGHSHARQHQYQLNDYSSDYGEPPFTPTRPGRISTAPHQSLGQVQQNRHTSASSNGGQTEPLYNNRFNPIVENDSSKVDVNQTFARRETRDFPLQDLHETSDSASSDPSQDPAPKDSPIQSIPQDGLVASVTDPLCTVSGQRRHPGLSVEKGLRWKTDREYGKNPKLDDEELLDGLKGRDHAFLIDDAESMAAHWPQVKRVFELLSYMVRDCDPNGLDLYFTSTSKAFKSRSTNTLMRELGKMTPKGLPDMRLRLGSIIEKYQGRFGKRMVRSLFRVSDPRKLSLYVLTDAVWQPKIDLTTTIRTLVKSLEDHGLGNKQVGIQFIRFGNHPQSIQRLQELDSGLKLSLDIIDTTPADGNVWKMLLGPVNDWYDDD